MRRSKSKISMLPDDIRTQINRKIRDGWKYRTIRDWLFAQRAQHDIADLNLKTGDPYSLIWTRDANTTIALEYTCIHALSKWYNTHYRAWLDEQLSGDHALRVVEENERLNSLASDKSQSGSNTGGNLIIRSLLIEAIRALCQDKKAPNPAQLARLANAWARMADAGSRGQEALDAGLQTLRDEIKKDPKALAQFNKLYATLKHPAKKAS